MSTSVRVIASKMGTSLKWYLTMSKRLPRHSKNHLQILLRGSFCALQTLLAACGDTTNLYFGSVFMKPESSSVGASSTSATNATTIDLERKVQELEEQIQKLINESKQRSWKSAQEACALSFTGGSTIFYAINKYEKCKKEFEEIPENVLLFLIVTGLPTKFQNQIDRNQTKSLVDLVKTLSNLPSDLDENQRNWLNLVANVWHG